MRQCPYCGTMNADDAWDCRSCHQTLPQVRAATTGTYWIGPEKAKRFRSHMLFLIVLGLMIKIYWGGYGPWPVIDIPVLSDVQHWLGPLLLYGGAVGYCVGWVLKRV